MKNNGKKIAILILLVAAAFFILKPSVKDRTFDYVKANQQYLTKTALHVISENRQTHFDYEDFTVSYFPNTYKPIVEFTVTSFGIAPSGYYKGFYFSPDDMPVRFQGSGVATENYKNGWRYSADGDNQGYIEKICDYWYWFEYSF